MTRGEDSWMVGMYRQAGVAKRYEAYYSIQHKTRHKRPRYVEILENPDRAGHGSWAIFGGDGCEPCVMGPDRLEKLIEKIRLEKFDLPRADETILLIHDGITSHDTYGEPYSWKYTLENGRYFFLREDKEMLNAESIKIGEIRSIELEDNPIIVSSFGSVGAVKLAEIARGYRRDPVIERLPIKKVNHLSLRVREDRLVISFSDKKSAKGYLFRIKRSYELPK